MRGPTRELIVPFFALLHSVLPPSVLAQVHIQQGSILITHISADYEQASDEFAVLFNAGGDTVNLEGYEMRYFTSSGSPGSAGATFSEPALLPPGKHLLVASRETVQVGSALALRDAQFTSGMATSGGQLVLRRTDLPDSIIFAAAWGSVSSYVGGMTDAAVWSGDGMLSLAWDGSAYVRAAYNGSNLEYSHTSSGNISSLPSLGPPPLVQPDSWNIAITLSQGTSTDTTLRAGMDPAATYGFDSMYDLPKPPPPVGPVVTGGFRREDLNLETGEHLLRDIRGANPLADTSFLWQVEIFPFESGTAVSFNADLTSLPDFLPVILRDVQTGTAVIRSDDSLSYEFVPSGTGPYTLALHVGDTSGPAIQFLSPSPADAFVAGKEIVIQFDVADASGVDSIAFWLEDLVTGSSTQIMSESDTITSFSWPLPARLLTDSARVACLARDSMGNESVAASGVFRIVPDSVTRSFPAGWHLFSAPIDPLDRGVNEALSFNRADSVFLFGYANGGYRLADSLIPGRGYFLGTAVQRLLRVVGFSPFDTLETEFSPGFVMLSSPASFPVPVDQLEILQGGLPRTYQEAVSSGAIAAGVFGYDHNSGVYVPVDSLHPWQGYWMPVLQTGVSVRLSSLNNSPGLRTRNNESGGWRVRLTVEQRGRLDSLVTFGVLPSATDGFDPAFDLPAPPPPPSHEGPEVFFRRQDWKVVTGDRFLSDNRGGAGPEVWFLSIRSAPGEIVTLRWKIETGDVPEDGRLADPVSGSEVRLTRYGFYQFPGGEERTIVFRATTVTNVPSDAELPERFTIGGSFPNPFNGITHIVFTLPAPARVSLQVSDVLGRKVMTRVQSEAPTGRTIYPLDLNSATGTYVVRITAKELGGERRWSGTTRIVLIR